MIFRFNKKDDYRVSYCFFNFYFFPFFKFSLEYVNFCSKMSSFFQVLANSGISPLVPPHSTLTAFSSQKSNLTQGGCSDEEEDRQKVVNTWTRRKCIWRWRRRVGMCTKVEACFRLVSCFCFTLLLVIVRFFYF